MFGPDDGRNIFTTKNAVVEHHNNPRVVMDKVVGEVVPDVHNLFPISERFRNFQASSSALHLPLLHSELFYYLLMLLVFLMCQ